MIRNAPMLSSTQHCKFRCLVLQELGNLSELRTSLSRAREQLSLARVGAAASPACAPAVRPPHFSYPFSLLPPLLPTPSLALLILLPEGPTGVVMVSGLLLDDSFIADMAFSTAAGQIKACAPCCKILDTTIQNPLCGICTITGFY